MKPKHAFILVGVVALVLGAIAVKEYVLKPRAQKSKQVSELFFPQFDPDRADQVDLGSGNTATILVRDKDKVWKVKTKSEFPADPESVKVLLDGVKGMKQTNLASEAKGHHEQLGVADSAYRVVVRAAGQTAAEFLVGNQGKNPGTYFVRKPGEDQTYLVLEDVKNWTDGQMGEWRDKTIFKEDKANLATATFTLRTETVAAAPGATPIEKPLPGIKIYTIRHNRDNDTWEYAAGDSVVTLDKSKTEGLIQTLVDLKAVEFGDTVSAAKVGLNPPNKEVAFKMQDGRAFGLYVGNSDGAKFSVRRSDLDMVMKVYRYQIDNIFKSKDALLAPGGTTPGNALPPPDLPPPVIRAPRPEDGQTAGPHAPPKPGTPSYPPPNETDNPEPVPPIEIEPPPAEPPPPPPPPVDDTDVGGVPPGGIPGGAPPDVVPPGGGQPGAPGENNNPSPSTPTDPSQIPK